MDLVSAQSTHKPQLTKQSETGNQETDTVRREDLCDGFYLINNLLTFLKNQIPHLCIHWRENCTLGRIAVKSTPYLLVSSVQLLLKNNFEWPTGSTKPNSVQSEMWRRLLLWLDDVTSQWSPGLTWFGARRRFFQPIVLPDKFTVWPIVNSELRSKPSNDGVCWFCVRLPQINYAFASIYENVYGGQMWGSIFINAVISLCVYVCVCESRLSPFQTSG